MIVRSSTRPRAIPGSSSRRGWYVPWVRRTTCTAQSLRNRLSGTAWTLIPLATFLSTAASYEAIKSLTFSRMRRLLFLHSDSPYCYYSSYTRYQAAEEEVSVHSHCGRRRHQCALGLGRRQLPYQSLCLPNVGHVYPTRTDQGASIRFGQQLDGPRAG
jgi:hypothetical protein